MARRRKINKLNLFITIIITMIFLATFLLILNAIIININKHDYTYQRKANLLDLPLNTLDVTKLSGDTYKYYEDDQYYSILGIDVSSHQKNIDFKKVKDAGIEFVFIRVGYRGYTEGHINLDDNFYINYQNAKDNNLKIGVYFFSQAINEEEAIDEAYFVKDALKGLELDLPVVYDLEDIDYDKSRLNNISNEMRTKNAMAFSAKIEEFGFKAMIYTNLEWANSVYDLEQIYNYPIWFAQYNEYPSFDYYFNIWQYTDSAIIDGIPKPVDMNIMLMEK